MMSQPCDPLHTDMIITVIYMYIHWVRHPLCRPRFASAAMVRTRAMCTICHLHKRPDSQKIMMIMACLLADMTFGIGLVLHVHIEYPLEMSTMRHDWLGHMRGKPTSLHGTLDDCGGLESTKTEICVCA